MFDVGDIVEIFAPSAGKKKYHLCVCALSEHSVIRFLFINSKDGFEADLTLSDGAITCLPVSPTGKTVISCNMVTRYRMDQLKLFQARKLGVLDKQVGAQLAAHIAAGRALSNRDQMQIVAALNEFVNG
jgi:hypothetical protein